MQRMNRDIRPLPIPAGAHAALAAADGGIVRFIAGVDAEPRPMTAVEIAEQLNDPLAALLLRRDVFPRSLDEVLDGLNAHNGASDGLSVQESYLVGEGSQLPPPAQAPGVDRQLRFVVTRAAAAAPDGQVDLLISASVAGDPAQTFLQIMAWDPQNEVFNFYAREGERTWIWAGASRHALAPESRGQGPFDSHVNGTMVMKELKQPWLNWHSMNAGISAEALPPGDAIRQNPLFTEKLPAERLERSVVRPGVRRWNAVRVRNAVAPDGTIANVSWFLRQLFTTTTVNLTTSTMASRSVQAAQALDLPPTFFINRDALINGIGLTPNITAPRVSGAFYLASLEAFEFTLRAGPFRREGDVFFAFLTPEPAFEDVDLVLQLVRAGVLTRKFVASVLMVDFPNPVFSPRRETLLRYVPEAASVPAAGLSEMIAQAIVAASAVSPAGSPEREFAANWELAEDAWPAAFAGRIETYFAAVKTQLATQEGFFAFVRLADSRRREFSPLPLNESPLLLPITNIPADAPLLQMTAEGRVVTKP